MPSVHTQQQQQPLMAHTHSHTVMFSHQQQHTHRVTLMKHWVPGQDGNPEATLNHAALCDELNARLLNADRTLRSMLAAGSNRRRAATTAAGSMEACRRQLIEGSLEKQVAFSTALMLDWCGATPVGSSEAVLAQLLATTT